MNEIVKQLEAQGFTKDQINEIRKGAEAGLNITVYAKKKFLSIQMQQIRLGLEKGLSVEEYAKTEYDWFQMEEIRKGLESGVDISQFASPEISYDRMQQIRLGLEEGINLSVYRRLDSGIIKQIRLATANHVNIAPYIVEGYDADQLEAIREALEKGLDIQPWIQKYYRGIALREIFAGLEEGLDVSPYAKVEYTWQQMREIRLGMEHMVDIGQYSSVFYSHRQMREIRLGLEEGMTVSYFNSPMYTAGEMEKRRLYLKEHPTAIHQERREDQAGSRITGIDPDEKFYKITIAEDEMEAYLHVFGSASDFNKYDIVRALHKKGICYGIRYEVIDDVTSGNSQRKPLLIAKGKEVMNGQDGWYEFFFRTQVEHLPKLLEDGCVDYRDVEWCECVEKGQKLACYHHAKRGENGITVTGKVVPSLNGREKKILTGKGFKRLEDGITYISEMKGMVTLFDTRMDVSEVLAVKEVNMATGDVEYDGNVLVEGNVGQGSTIKATKDVIIYGFVEAAKIISGGSVFLRKGMNGSGNGSIQAKQNVIGSFFESAEVYAQGDIQGDYFFRSNLHAQGLIRAVGRKGAISGGSTWAESGLMANSLGNSSGLVTEVKLGSLERIRKEELKLEETMNGVRQELSILENAHRDFQNKYSAEIRNTMEIYLKIESAIYTKEKEMNELLAEKNRLEEETKKSGLARAVVSDQVYEGVTLEIDGVSWRASDVKGVTLQRTGNRVAVFSK
ncbi:MAG: DUF342 domain-containing protein [Lachnospiraceae bacterium]